MKASKDNKVYTIDTTQKDYYIAQGYDILNDEGDIIEYGAGKSVSYKEYEELTREERYELGATEEILFVCIDMGAEAVKA